MKKLKVYCVLLDSCQDENGNWYVHFNNVKMQVPDKAFVFWDTSLVNAVSKINIFEIETLNTSWED